MSKEKVELIPAYEWTCNSCGASNFARSVPVLISNLPEETQAALNGAVQELKDQHPDIEIEDQEGGALALTMPETVICKECHTEFEVYFDLMAHCLPPPEPDENEN